MVNLDMLVSSKNMFMWWSSHQIQNFVFTIFLSLIGSFNLVYNIIIIFYFIKYKTDGWTFASCCTLELLILNIIGSCHCYLIAMTNCLFYIDYRLCLLLNCLEHYILFSSFKINFCFAGNYNFKTDNRFPIKMRID